MGTWGTGNFDNDHAGDFYSSVIDYLATEIDTAMNAEVELDAGGYYSDIVPAAIEIILALDERKLHCLDLDADEVRIWKRTYMEKWHATVDRTGMDSYYREERERVLNETFDRLIALAEP